MVGSCGLVKDSMLVHLTAPCQGSCVHCWLWTMLCACALSCGMFPRCLQQRCCYFRDAITRAGPLLGTNSKACCLQWRIVFSNVIASGRVAFVFCCLWALQLGYRKFQPLNLGHTACTDELELFITSFMLFEARSLAVFVLAFFCCFKLEFFRCSVVCCLNFSDNCEQHFYSNTLAVWRFVLLFVCCKYSLPCATDNSAESQSQRFIIYTCHKGRENCVACCCCHFVDL